MESLNILKIAISALDEKKARQLKVIKVGDLTALTEYFIIATATSSVHVHALADEVEVKLEENGCRPHHIEGKSTGWIVLDFESVIVHVFTPDQREFYGLDRMWSDGEEIDISEFIENSKED